MVGVWVFYSDIICWMYVGKRESVCVCVLVLRTLKRKSLNILAQSIVKGMRRNTGIQSVQFSLFAQSCPTLCDPVECSTPGFPVHHQLPELTQTHVHWVDDAIHPAHPPLSSSPPAFNLSRHQGLFKWVSSSHQVAKVLEFQLQHQFFRWIFRTNVL